MKKTEIVLTSDGSHSLYIPELNEHYHSHHGALRESNHVFIENGLKFISKSGHQKLKIFEMGFGTGLNALLTLQFMMEHKVPEILYHSIEAFPLTPEITSQLNYPEILHQDSLSTTFDKMHGTPDDTIELQPGFVLKREIKKLEDFETDEKFDLVYYDAFGPRVQPELWEESALRKVVALMSSGAVLVTYCAQGKFRRILRELDMQLESLPGPPGKREMTRAVKR